MHGKTRQGSVHRQLLRLVGCAVILYLSQSFSPAAVPCINGFAASFPCENVNLLRRFPSSVFGTGTANDIWGWTDPTSGTDYALVGLTNGVAFVDLSDPENPVYLGMMPTQTVNSSWRDIKTFNSYAFVVSEAPNHGMQIMDLSRLARTTSRGLA